VKKLPVGRSGDHIHLVTDGQKTRVVLVESEYRFAFELKNAARVMAKKARSISDKDSYELLAFVTGAVTLSYSYLEAALNEFIFLNATAQESHLNESEKAIVSAIASEDLRPQGRQNTLQLFNTILRLLRKPQLTENKEPYQSANLVRCLRNLLVHPVPGRVITFSEDPNSNLSEQQQIVKQLRSHLGFGRNATFPRDVLNSRCATWAVASCERFLHEFVKQSGVDPGFITE